MSTIRVIYRDKEPNWPATDNHPDAVRFEIEHPERGKLWVDAVGGEPTLAEIETVLNPAP